MSYKLQKLSVKNFVGVSDATMSFEKQVSMIVGQNRTGKSSLRDALMFAFTGKARSVTKYKDVSQLAHTGDEEKMMVDLDFTTDDELCKIKRNVKKASQGVEGFNPLIPYCLSPIDYIRLPASQRGRILASVVGAGLDKLIEEAINEHIGEVDEAVLAEIKGTGVNMHDIAGLLEAAIELRRGYKRELKDLSVDEPLLTDYALDGLFEIDKTEKNLAKVEARIEDGVAKVADEQARQQREANMFDLRKQIKKLQGQIKPITQHEYEMVRQIAISQHSALLAEEAIKKNICAVCGQDIDKNFVKARLKKTTDWLKDNEHKSEEIKEREKANINLSVRLDVAGSRLAEVEVLVAEDKKKPLAAVAENLLSELRERRRMIQDQINNYRRYKTDCAVRDEALKRKSILENYIEECNQIDEALKDGGAVKSQVAAGGRTLPINRTMLGLWGMDGLSWKDNGEILLDERPIEQASESEKFMAACVMGMALAEVGDVGFAALDGFEILQGENPNLFFDAVQESKLNNVLIFVSSAVDYSSREIPDWMDVFVLSQDKKLVKL